MSPGRDRRAAFARGVGSESLAALWLRLKGYRVLARRYRTRLGEIDLVVRRGRTVAFVEVKARKSFDAALEAVTARGQRRIVDAAHAWMAQAGLPADITYRFDIVLVAPWRAPRHLVDAFQAH